MKVFIAGGTGVIASQLVPQLLDGGHTVVAMARSSDRTGPIEQAGAQVVLGDALVWDETRRVIAEARPDAVVDLLTAIPSHIDPRHIDRDMAATNRLRTRGTTNLLDASHQAGVERAVVESVSYVVDPSYPAVTDESAHPWREPPKRYQPSIDAVLEHEARALAADATVLRFGHLYGPGTIYDHDGDLTQQIRAGKVPIVGDGGSVFSFIHTADAAHAIVQALEHEPAGVVNVVDDEPEPMAKWLPDLATMLGAPQPRHIPRWIARLAVGSFGVAWMTALRGSSNERAKQVLDWQPARPSWRQGLRSDVSRAPR